MKNEIKNPTLPIEDAVLTEEVYDLQFQSDMIRILALSTVATLLLNYSVNNIGNESDYYALACGLLWLSRGSLSISLVSYLLVDIVSKFSPSD